MRVVPLTLRAPLSESIARERPVSFSIGPRGEAVVLLAADADADDVIGHDTSPGWATFPHSTTPRPIFTTVLVHDGRSASRIALHDPIPAHPHVQPLPADEVLVVGARCWHFKDGIVERNALVYGADGRLCRAVTYGDGVQHVQATTRGEVWVSYFDEGVYGNYGWGGAEEPRPIGASGLIRFDQHGTQWWQYAPPEGVDRIDDCYALNVTDVAAWAYYYSSFTLVHIGRDYAVTAWRTEISGARAFATDGEHVLFYGGYAEESERCLLGRLQYDAVGEIAPCRLIVPSGKPLSEAAYVVGRGPVLHLFIGTDWYSVDVHELSGAVGSL